MNREPIALYLFRFVLGFGLFAFMAMLYWSSALLESDLKGVRTEFVQLRSDLLKGQGEVQRLRSDILQALLCTERAPRQTISVTENTPEQRPKNEHGVNILENDHFHDVILPKLLGKDFKPHGILRSDSLARPENLHPFSNWGDVNDWNSMCRGALAESKFGIQESETPSMALRIEERVNPKSQGPEYWIFLRQNMYWQPLEQRFFGEEIRLAPQFMQKQPVTAADFKLYFDALMNPHMQMPGAVALRNYFGDIENIEIIDDYTFIVRWRTVALPQRDGVVKPTVSYLAKLWTGALKPLPGFVYKYFADGSKILEEDAAPDSYRNSSVWAQNLSEHWTKNAIISCGPWLFDGFGDSEIRFKRDPNYFDPLAVLVETFQVNFRSSSDAIWQDFKAGNTDSYALQPEKLTEWEEFQRSPLYAEQKSKGLEIKRLDHLVRMYSYIGWNEARPQFKSAKVRRALTMAIDRQRIIEQNLNGMGIPISGPFFRYSKAYDNSIESLPFDPTAARRLLEAEGWSDSDGDGILDKEIDGQRVVFRFSLNYYVKNALFKSIAESIAVMLRDVGIDCQLNGVDTPELTRAFDDKNFDALFLLWGYGSPPDNPEQVWHSKGAKEKGSSNAIGFANAEADGIIGKLEYTHDLDERVSLYHRFHRIIHEEQPYTFLFIPKRILLYRSYLQNVFIPAERQDWIPGADVTEPQSSIFWIKG